MPLVHAGSRRPSQGSDRVTVEAGSIAGAARVGPELGPPRPTGPPVSGPVLFARYAFGPNRLGYCGPDASAELIGEASRPGGERAIRELARGFEGAWPYLELIAASNGIADPLDRRVVEAYWLGSELLDAVRPDALAASLAVRFRPRLRPEGWRWLGEKPAAGAVPIHAFHVLDVFPRVGLLRSGSTDRPLQVMDQCRVRWGRVHEVCADSLVVDVVPLVLVDGRLRLGPARPERVEAWEGGAGFVAGVQPGEMVSVHWSFACDRLSPDQVRRLAGWTRRQLQIANQTV
jgi:hypothetical protein